MIIQWIHRAQIFINISLVILATYIIGTSLPGEHRYAGGWIFGLAWFPIILFATIEFVTMGGLSKKIIGSILSFILPFLIIGVNVLAGNGNITSFIVQSAMLQFTASMIAFALQAAIFPPLFGKVQRISAFIQEEALPQLFGAGIGCVMSYLAFQFLLSHDIITTQELPILAIGIIYSSINLGFMLYKTRYA